MAAYGAASQVGLVGVKARLFAFAKLAAASPDTGFNDDSAASNA